jgi:hypothetical protein
MSENFQKLCVYEILKRLLPDGGFALFEKGKYRPDATAWAILSLESLNKEATVIENALSRLKEEQDKDGRVSVQKGLTAAYWTTSLAALAWHGKPAYQESYDLSINFLISTSGQSSPRKSYIGHDTTLKGWPWIEGTHSWVEPTALAVLALKGAGYEKNNRVTEALQLILDRQLPHGGWNYGNTDIFGQKLRADPYSTGITLYALAGLIDRKDIHKSIKYLGKRVEKDRTPLSLGWEIMSLCAWDEYQFPFDNYLIECWDLQKRYGKYNTSFLSTILLAYAMLFSHAKPL